MHVRTSLPRCDTTSCTGQARDGLRFWRLSCRLAASCRRANKVTGRKDNCGGKEQQTSPTAARPTRAERTGQVQHGNEWVVDCNSSDLGKLTGCTSYARGIADGLRTWEFLYPNAPVCIPEAVLASELVDVGRNYIRNNPGARQEGAGWLLALAFKETWPCRKGAA